MWLLLVTVLVTALTQFPGDAGQPVHLAFKPIESLVRSLFEIRRELLGIRHATVTCFDGHCCGPPGEVETRGGLPQFLPLPSRRAQGLPSQSSERPCDPSAPATTSKP